jgi:hypothetical protein
MVDTSTGTKGDRLADRGPLQAIAAGKQLRAADRKNLLGAQPRRFETRPIAIAVPHCNVDVRNPRESGHGFRRKATTDSDPSRTVIPIDRGQP